MTSACTPLPTLIGGLTIDCDDAAAMVAFYAEAFGGVPDPAFPRTPCVRVDGLLLVFRENPDRAQPAWPGSDPAGHPFCIFEWPAGCVTPTCSTSGAV